jgi:hypothetical protein
MGLLVFNMLQAASTDPVGESQSEGMPPAHKKQKRRGTDESDI